MKTIAQQLNIKKFPFEIKNENNILIYLENPIGKWERLEYDLKNNRIFYENSIGEWQKCKYDSNNNMIYFEDSNGYWEKYEYDSNNKVIYFEDYNGYIEDNRPKVELTLDEIASKFGIPISQLKIKK